MKYPFRFLSILLLVLGVSLVSVGSASAQAGSPWGGVTLPGEDPPGMVGGAGGVQAEPVTKTLVLTLDGEVPEGESHAVVYETNDPVLGSDVIVFCGSEDTLGNPTPECTGGGKVYKVDLVLQAGTVVNYGFARVNVDGRKHPVFYERGTETVSEDMATTARFAYGEDDPAGDDGAAEDGKQGGPGGGDLPRTGGVGTGASSPMASAVAAFALLAIGACFLPRRRWCTG